MMYFDFDFLATETTLLMFILPKIMAILITFTLTVHEANGFPIINSKAFSNKEIYLVIKKLPNKPLSR